VVNFFSLGAEIAGQATQEGEVFIHLLVEFIGRYGKTGSEPQSKEAFL
jgi:hypothetical protein